MISVSMPEKLGTGQPLLSPSILPFHLEGFPQHEDWAASPMAGKEEPRSSKLIQQVTQGINNTECR